MRDIRSLPVCLPHTCVQVKESQSPEEASGVISEVQSLKEQLERSLQERKALETQLSEASGSVTQLQEQGSRREREREIFQSNYSLIGSGEKGKGRGWRSDAFRIY